MNLPSKRTLHVYPQFGKRKHQVDGRMCWCDPTISREVKPGARGVRAWYIVRHFVDPVHRKAA